MVLHVFGPRKRILYLYEQPRRGERRDYVREVGRIAEAIELGPQPARMELDALLMMSRDCLSRALLRWGCDTFVFAGHGPTFGLCDDRGEEQREHFAAALGELLAANCRPNACVLLMGCGSSVLAPALAVRELRGVSFDVAVTSAAILAFLGGYFDGLSAGRSHERAYEDGCRSMAFEHHAAALATLAFGPDLPGFGRHYDPIHGSPDTDTED